MYSTVVYIQNPRFNKNTAISKEERDVIYSDDSFIWTRFVPSRYFRINELSGLLNHPLVRTGKSVPTLMSRLARFLDYRSPD